MVWSFKNAVVGYVSFVKNHTSRKPCINVVYIVDGYSKHCISAQQFRNFLPKREFSFLFLISLFVLFHTPSFHLDEEGKTSLRNGHVSWKLLRIDFLTNRYFHK